MNTETVFVKVGVIEFTENSAHHLNSGTVFKENHSLPVHKDEAQWLIVQGRLVYVHTSMPCMLASK